MFGIAEDPATGAAAAAFADLIAQSSQFGDETHSIVIEQGYEMGRPSLITLGMTIAQGKFTAATVSEGKIEA